MFKYKKDWKDLFIFKERKSHPFYDEEEVEIFNKNKNDIIKELKNDWDFFCLFWLLLYKSNWVIAWYELWETEYELLSLYEWELKINNKWWFDFLWEKVLEKIKEEKLSEIHKKARNRIKNEVYIRKERNWIIEYYDDWEIKTWSEKVKEAKVVIWGWESELLSSYTPAGLTVKKYAKKILKKAKIKSIIVARIEKEKNKAIYDLFNN